VKCHRAGNARGAEAVAAVPAHSDQPPAHGVRLLLFFFSLVTGPKRSLSLKLSDTRWGSARLFQPTAGAWGTHPSFQIGFHICLGFRESRRWLFEEPTQSQISTSILKCTTKNNPPPYPAAAAEREGNLLKGFQEILPKIWLKPTPESGLDCLICAEFGFCSFQRTAGAWVTQ